jgi:hypothetical protein
MQTGPVSAEKTMLRALGELLSRGVVILSVCLTSAFCIAGFLSLITPSLHPRGKNVAEASAGCKPGPCGHKIGPRRQLAEK